MAKTDQIPWEKDESWKEEFELDQKELIKR